MRTGDQTHIIEGVLQVGEARTFTISTNGSNETLASLVDPNLEAVVDAVHARDVAIARFPDGTGAWWNVPNTTPDSANRVELSDAIVVNEIMYHHQPNYADYAVSEEEWIELFNRSDTLVDLSGWSLTDAFQYSLPDGTTLGAGEHLVIAKDPVSLATKFPLAKIIGGYSESLNNGGDNIQLRDVMGNLADEVHYYDSGRWPAAADGGGASLELIDPDADNSIPESWRASTEHAEWKTYSHRVTATTARRLNVPSGRFHEIIFGLLDEGEVLLDDIRVVEDPAAASVDRMQNGDFESDTPGASPTSWRIIGNHHGEVIADPDDPSNQVLKLTANGPTEHMHNHAEVTFANRARIDSGGEYEISFKAKWLSGSPLFNSRLYFVRGANTTVLETETTNGTPGEVNGNLRDNSGPTYSNLKHSPLVPKPDEVVTVSIVASDPDRVTDMTLHYAVDRGDFVRLPMTPRTSGEYVAEIPGQANNDIVNFYVTGTDSQGATSHFPAEGPESRALYRIEGRDIPNDDVHSFRLILTPDDVSMLHANTNVMSNGRLGATVIYNDTEVFYDVGVRMRASGY
ncbi:lamin tail domain-containing protein, partial [Planctomycetota bacterium]